MSTLKVPGARLSYGMSGSGPLMILVPGAADVGEALSSQRWYGMVGLAFRIGDACHFKAPCGRFYHGARRDSFFERDSCKVQRPYAIPL